MNDKYTPVLARNLFMLQAVVIDLSVVAFLVFISVHSHCF